MRGKMEFKRILQCLLLTLMPIYLVTGCGDLEPEMQDTRTVILNMDFHGKSSSRSSSSVSASELSQYNTHLILALPSWEVLTSNYRNFHNSFAQGLMNTADKKVSLEIPLNTQMKIFAFLFKENYSMSELFSGVREVGYYGESQSFSIGTQTNNLSLGITLIQVPGTGTDTDGGTDTGGGTDYMAPTVTFSPANGATGVTISNNIAITFSEAVRNIDNTVLTDSNSGDANGVGSLITLRLNNTYGTNIAFYATIDTNKTVITIDPTNNLPHSQAVYVAIGATVEDSAGNPITAANATFTTTTVVENITISSSASDNASVAFGQSYQYQLATSGTYSGTVTFSLSNEPDDMTISSEGFIVWTPTKASEITTHSNIKIIITTASGYELTQTYDLTVTGTCVSGNVMAIWEGDQRSSTDSNQFKSNITAYTDNSSNGGDVCGEGNDEDCTAAKNYDLRDSSLHLTHGPTASATKGSIFFYNQYDNTSNLYLFYMFGNAGQSSANVVKLDVFSDNNTSTDNVVVTDDSGETTRYTSSSSCGTSPRCYKGRYSYDGSHSDGAVLGPFTGTDFRIFVDLGGTSTINSDTLTLKGKTPLETYPGLDSFEFFSKYGDTYPLGNVDNFTVGYKTSFDCSN